MRQPTEYPEANEILTALTEAVSTTLGPKLVGVYLYGSCVHGAFEVGRSDVDVLAAVTEAIEDAEFRRLGAMHAELVRRFPNWDDRVEVQYVTLEALGSFLERASRFPAISPGDPLSWKEGGADWCSNWYDVRESGLTLLGPDPRGFIAPVSREDFVRCIREYLFWRTDHLGELGPHCGALAYGALTMCRGVYTLRTGEQISKQAAAAWAAEEFPAWALVIRRALEWMQPPACYVPPEDPVALAATLAFISEMRETAAAAR